jgi:endoglucanase
MMRGRKWIRGIPGLLALAMAVLGCASLGGSGWGAAASAPKTSIDMAMAMGNGINLGNTMEAYGRSKLGTKAPVSDYETFWGQPLTTREMIKAMHKAGFSSLRIPVAWTNTMDFTQGDYTISPAYLDRVGQIASWAIDEGMYAVINDHWDGGWWGMFGSRSEETRKKAMDLYVSMWGQIAEKYKDYSPKLILESANEELGDRLNDKDIAADSGSLSRDECYAAVNRINQAFVDTVRKAGGKNADRFLLVAGYNTGIEPTLDPRFSMPKDAAKDRLLVSVHYYEPSDYCVNTSVNRWGFKQEYAKMNALFKRLIAFTNAGYGVVVGEYAVSLKQDGTVKNDTYGYLANLLDNCDLYGCCPMLWDCSSLFKRSELRFIDAESAALFQSRSPAARKGMSRDKIANEARLSIGSALVSAKEAPTVADDAALAWIMYNSGDWGMSYSVGDKYNPGSKSDGVVAKDPPITGPGTYTVSLDFSGTAAGSASGVGFSAIGVANGEKLFPGYVIDIKEVLVNGKPFALSGNPYTTSDDGTCTRVNLYNAWVTQIPDGIRVARADAGKPSACVVDPKELGQVKTISITFEYRPR